MTAFLIIAHVGRNCNYQKVCPEEHCLQAAHEAIGESSDNESSHANCALDFPAPVRYTDRDASETRKGVNTMNHLAANLRKLRI
ncbi:MAG: hypothetical protein IJO39_03390, partial [Clostridia bacterium]|nr:hypothetical protein [Clostridia bacterium]